MRAASQLPGRGPTQMWMMPLHLHINQKSDYDDDCYLDMVEDGKMDSQK